MIDFSVRDVSKRFRQRRPQRRDFWAPPHGLHTWRHLVRPMRDGAR